MSFWHPELSTMHPALLAHHQRGDHRLVADPVNVAPGGAVDPLTYHGGPTIPDPQVTALFAGTFWDDQAGVSAFTGRIVENGYLQAAVGQGTKPGKYLGSFAIAAPPSAQITDADCRTMLQAAVGRNGIVVPNPNALYLLLLPDGVEVAFDQSRTERSCQQFCGYHSSMVFDGQPLYYAVHPATTCNGCYQTSPRVGLQMVIGHEIVEACTDPDGRGWFNDRTGEENGDECAWVQDTYGQDITQGYAAQNAAGSWVNSIGLYVPPAVTKVATRTFLGATPNPAAVGQTVTLQAKVSAADGSQPGGVVTIDPSLASPAPLPASGSAIGQTATQAGIFTLRASYPGDATYEASQSNPLSLVVQAPQGGGGQGWQPDPILTQLYDWQKEAADYIDWCYKVGTAERAAEALAWEQQLTQTILEFWPYVQGQQGTHGQNAILRLPRVPR